MRNALPGRGLADNLFALTPLIPVVDWVWNRYKVVFRDELEQTIFECEFVGTDGPQDRDFDVEWGGMQWPHRANTYEWELVEENIKTVRVERARYGMVCHGDGWKREK